MRFLAPCLFVLVGLGVWGCHDEAGHVSRTVRGSGHVVEMSFPVGDFDTLAFAAVGDVHLTQGDVESLRIVGEDNLLDELIVEVKNHTLTIKTSRGVSLEPTEPLDYYVGVKSVDSVTLSGAGDLDAARLVTDGNFALVLSGVGDVDIDDLQAVHLDVVVTGDGTLRLAGQVQTQNVTASGVLVYRARGLVSQKANVFLSGVGQVEILAAQRLMATISGTGSICYDGNPETTATISGTGSVGTCAGP